MKLKLDAQGEVKILRVTEELAIQHAAILKVGLRKMFQTGVRKFILDLSAVGPTTPEALKSVAEGARADASKLGIELLVVSDSDVIADASSTDKALAHFGGANEVTSASTSSEASVPAADVGAARPSDHPVYEEEAQLQAQMRKLQRRKAALEQHLSKAGEQDVRTLKKDFSDLARSVQRLEGVVTALAAKRREPAFLSSSERKIRRVTEILTAVLEQEGILPIK